MNGCLITRENEEYTFVYTDDEARCTEAKGPEYAPDQIVPIGDFRRALELFTVEKLDVNWEQS